MGLIENFLSGDFGTTQTWLGNYRLKVAGLILLFNLCEMPKVNLGHKLSIYDTSFQVQGNEFL